MSPAHVPVILAQAVPSFDTSTLVTYGPLGIAVMGLVWYVGRLQDRIDKMIEAHKAELASERALNARLQEQRLEDQRVLIPLVNSLTVVMEMAKEHKR